MQELFKKYKKYNWRDYSKVKRFIPGERYERFI